MHCNMTMSIGKIWVIYTVTIIHFYVQLIFRYASQYHNDHMLNLWYHLLSSKMYLLSSNGDEHFLLCFTVNKRRFSWRILICVWQLVACSTKQKNIILMCPFFTHDLCGYALCCFFPSIKDFKNASSLSTEQTWKLFSHTVYL